MPQSYNKTARTGKKISKSLQEYNLSSGKKFPKIVKTPKKK